MSSANAAVEEMNASASSAANPVNKPLFMLPLL
jgi:hypothetical protein